MADLKTPYGTRLCLSGLESRKLLETFAQFGVQHIQVSYYYLKRVFHDPIDFEQYSAPFTTVLIDSGTVYQRFRTDDEKHEFINDYSSYIAALNKKAYTACVYEKNSNLEKVCSDDALIYPVDVVADVFDNSLVDLYKNILYVGIPQKDIMYKGGDALKTHFQCAKQFNRYVHAFGTSSKRILNKWPFYSANSSSWRSGSRYLNTYIYEGPGRGMRQYQPKDKKGDPIATEKEMYNIRKRQYQALLTKRPHIAALIDKDLLLEEGNSWEVDKANLGHWMKYQEDLENNSRNTYWLSDNEKSTITQRKRALTSMSTEGAPNTNPNNEYRHIEDIESSKDPIESKENIDPIEIEDAVVIDENGNEEDLAISTNENNENLIIPAPSHISINSRPYPVDKRQYVKRQCEDCSLNDRCVKYTPNGECAYGLSPELEPSIEDTPDVIRQQMLDMLLIQYDRLQQSALEERLDSAGLNRDTTANMKLMTEMHRQYMELLNPQPSLTVKAKGSGALDIFKKKA